MTTHLPYGPEHEVAVQTYPAAPAAPEPAEQWQSAPAWPTQPDQPWQTQPPWTGQPQEQVPPQLAAPQHQPAEPPPPVYGAVAPYGTPYPEHGGLIVAHPEEFGRVRADSPAVWPVVVFTLLFSFFGMLSARRRARQASRAGAQTTPYWLAFWVTWAAGSAVTAVLAVAVGVPALLAYREGALTKQVQSQIVNDGTMTSRTGLTATNAECTLLGRLQNGKRAYSCAVDLSDGRSGTLNVESDDDGNWTLAVTA